MEILHRDVPMDANTLPQWINVRNNSKFFETRTINLVVGDIMKNLNSKTCIVYSYNGSGMNKVGSYMMQSLTIKGVRRSLPTLHVFAKTMETL